MNFEEGDPVASNACDQVQRADYEGYVVMVQIMMIFAGSPLNLPGL